MPDKEPDLDAAYALETPDDSRRLYANWAQTYESEFATRMAYRLPQIVALILAERMTGPAPLLDVGAGTGLIADHFPLRGMFEIDALDISSEMLAVAMAKGYYRKAIEADLTATLDIADGIYGAVVSAGTFTHGHVGPDALTELLRVTRKGGVFVISINAEHFDRCGFADAFADLAPRIEEPEFRDVNIYGTGSDDAHGRDLARIAVFSKR